MIARNNLQSYQLPTIVGYMSKVTKLLEDIKRYLSRDGKDYADLARELQKDYHQVYDWMTGRHKPDADNLMDLATWRNKNTRASAGERQPMIA